MLAKSIVRPIIITACVLMIPFIGTRVSSEWNWDLFDFILMGAIIFGTCFTYELVTRNSGTSSYRIAVGISLLAAFLLVWINLAVGIIGDEDNPANVMYFIILMIGMIGAVISRLDPIALSRTVFVMAGGIVLIPIIAVIIASPQITSEPPGIIGVIGLNVFFAMMFVVSGLLFQRASNTNEISN